MNTTSTIQERYNNKIREIRTATETVLTGGRADKFKAQFGFVPHAVYRKALRRS